MSARDTVKIFQGWGNRLLYKAGLRQPFRASLSKEFNGVALRRLSQPPQRLETREGFPEPESFTGHDYSAATNSRVPRIERAINLLEKELQKIDLSLQTVRRINIAFPQKNSALFPFHVNDAHPIAKGFQEQMASRFPHVDWVLADALCENRHLNLSGGAGIFNRLFKKQQYDLQPPKKPYLPGTFPFIEKGNKGRELFVFVDDCVAGGTTLANMKSFIEHNGGYVLCALTAAECIQTFLAPPGRRDELAQTFRLSVKDAGLDWSAKECFDRCEVAVNGLGHSLNALTDHECQLLGDYVIYRTNGKKSGFINLLGKLQAKASP